MMSKLKSALVTGILIIMPLWLAILLLVPILKKLGLLVKPITATLPESLGHPTLAGILIFLLLCLLVGGLSKTAVGHAVGLALGDNILGKVPGYSAFRGISRQLADFESEKGFKPVLIEIEDGCLSPACLIEDHGDGRSTIFLPSVPTPLAGSLLIMPNERIFPVNIPLPTMMKCISKWGTGSGEILAAMGRSKAE